MVRKRFLAFLLVFFLVLPGSAFADGGIFPPGPYWAQEVSQKAVIVYENNIETLIISMNFDGNAQDFSWILPTPQRPQVSKAPSGLFSSLENLTTQYVPGLGAGPGANQPQGVNVVERKIIDIYDISVLQASSRDDLYNWLNANGYHYPAAGKYVLDSYINNGWYFTAIKVNTESMGIAQNQLRHGTASPIKLVFSSDKLVYPLKISSLTIGETGDFSGANVDMPITLYVLADREKKANRFGKEWLGFLDTQTIKDLALDDSGNPWYDAKHGLVLTKLTATIRPADMTEDVFLADKEGASPAPPAYDYSFVSQTDYPVVGKSDVTTLSIKLLNTGYQPWYKQGDNPICLGTSQPGDRASGFYTSGNSWLSPNRIKMDEDIVYPGEQATFTFNVAADNLNPGTYREYFTPVIEGKTWMKNIGIYWDITVGAGGQPSGGAYSYQWVSQSSYPVVSIGSTTQLSLTLLNTGSATWTKTGVNAIHLGTSHPNDRLSAAYHPSWLSTNRIAMDQDSVPPGQNATFTFTIFAPSSAGEKMGRLYREYFTPVIEGITWMKDIGIYWDVTAV